MLSANDKTLNVESLSARRELSEAAKALLADKAFGHAILALRQRWFQELTNQKTSGPAQDEIAARLRTLEMLATEIALLEQDYREAARRANAS